MGDVKNDSNFEHTHQTYRTPDEIQFRTQDMDLKEWERAKQSLLVNRKLGAIPFFLKSIDKKFWFFPADTILKKASDRDHMDERLAFLKRAQL